MDSKRFKRIREIFASALECSPGERAAYLEEACSGDAALREEVEKLLSTDGEADGFLETPATTGLPPGWSGGQLTGARLGQYRLERVISSGGMGTVYEATQEHPRRTVAVKVMKQGIVSRTALRRFEYEAQILARLRHPNIAQVIEAGTHCTNGDDSGVPYFVMEFIPEARSIAEFVQQGGLSVKKRLALFLQVCDAVHHGHQKGIIHRDLKPSNILVDATGQVKIIDFGVARATDSDVALTTMQTEVGQLIGTLQYMSPEQCKADPHDLDMRSDIYALGVVLFETLCESLPYDVSRTAVFEAARLIREAQPKRPSAVNRTLRGDVETIVLKAMEKEREHRYQTVADLGDDIERYLDGRVILAKPVSPWTRAWKQIRRNPLLSTAVGAVAVCLVSFLLYVLLWSYPRIQEEKVKLEREMEHTRMINTFLEEMLAFADPFKTGREIQVPEMLDRAAERIDTQFPELPEIEGSLRRTLGTTYLNNGRFDAAQKQLESALEIYDGLLGPNHPDTLIARKWVAVLYRKQGRFEEAESRLKALLKNTRDVLGEEHPMKFAIQYGLASLYAELGRYEEAEPLYLEALKGQRRVLAEDDDGIFRTQASLAGFYTTLGRFDEAESIMLEALEGRRRTLGEEHPSTIGVVNGLALIYQGLGRYDEAKSLYTRVLEVNRRVLGEEHPDTFNAMTNLANILSNLGQYDEAERLLKEALEGRRRTLGLEHPLTLTNLCNLASLYSTQDLHEKSEPLYAAALEALRRVLGDDHKSTLTALNGLASAYVGLRRFEEAAPLFEEALEGNRRRLGDDHPNTITAVNNLGHLYWSMGRLDEAEPLFVEALEGKRRVLGNDHTDTFTAAGNLGTLYFNQKRYEEAARCFAESLDGRRRILGNDHPHTLSSIQNLGVVSYRLGRNDEAITLMQEAYQSFRSSLGPDHPKTLSALRSLTNIEENLEKGKESE